MSGYLFTILVGTSGPHNIKYDPHTKINEYTNTSIHTKVYTHREVLTSIVLPPVPQSTGDRISRSTRILHIFGCPDWTWRQSKNERKTERERGREGGRRKKWRPGVFGCEELSLPEWKNRRKKLFMIYIWKEPGFFQCRGEFETAAAVLHSSTLNRHP